jgi:hypothetical protein
MGLDRRNETESNDCDNSAAKQFTCKHYEDPPSATAPDRLFVRIGRQRTQDPILADGTPFTDIGLRSVRIEKIVTIVKISHPVDGRPHSGLKGAS